MSLDQGGHVRVFSRQLLSLLIATALTPSTRYAAPTVANPSTMLKSEEPHQLAHHLQPSTHRERQQALAHVSDDLAIATLTCSGTASTLVSNSVI